MSRTDIDPPPPRLRLQAPLLTAVGLGLLLLAPGVRAARIACSESALKSKIASLNSNCSGDKTIKFDCSNQTIQIRSDATGGDKESRKIYCDDLVVDGENRNITFILDPPCSQGMQDGSCSGGGEGGEWLFVADGDNITFRNFTMSNFWEGIWAGRSSHGSTHGTVVENVTMIRPCDDVFTNQYNSTGTVFRNNTVRLGCDKCVTLKGRDAQEEPVLSMSPSDPKYYDSLILNNDFESCEKAISATSGRHLIKDNRFENRVSPVYRAFGPKFHESAVIHFEDNLVDDNRQGVRVTGTARIRVRGNVFRNNGARGVSLEQSSVGRFEFNRFEGNGGQTTGLEMYGGIHVDAGARADLGGGSVSIDGSGSASAGYNVFLDNRAPGGVDMDVWNASSRVVSAENNYWGDRDPSDQVQGGVDFTPLLDSEPGGSDPLPAPTAVWRTDQR